MDEEDNVFALEPTPHVSTPELISVCKCLLNIESSEEVVISDRKKFVLSTVARTENYLRERRIPELMRFLLTKIIAGFSKNPAEYGVKLLDSCMIFRAGLGVAPVVYEDRHLEAVVKSFDPGQRGWLSAGQVRRAFNTLGFNLNSEDTLDEKMPTHIVLKKLRKTQERELFILLSAGMNLEESNSDSQSTSTVQYSF